MLWRRELNSSIFCLSSQLRELLFLSFSLSLPSLLLGTIAHSSLAFCGMFDYVWDTNHWARPYPRVPPLVKPSESHFKRNFRALKPIESVFDMLWVWQCGNCNNISSLPSKKKGILLQCREATRMSGMNGVAQHTHSVPNYPLISCLKTCCKLVCKSSACILRVHERNVRLSVLRQKMFLIFTWVFLHHRNASCRLVLFVAVAHSCSCFFDVVNDAKSS